MARFPIGETEFKHLSTEQLLRLYAEVMEELRVRGVVRSSNNPVADYAEWTIADRLGLKLVGGSNRGFDATDTQGVRYQIKARRNTVHNRSRQLSVIRNLAAKDFDFLLGVIFNESFVLQELWKIPHACVEKYARYSKHQNGHILHLRGTLLQDQHVESLTVDAKSGSAPS